MIRIHVDEERCVGAGHCVRAATSVFDQRDEDGIVVLLMSEAPDAMRAKLEKAEELCPSQAIRIEVVEGG
jgi:ferredoxin